MYINYKTASILDKRPPIRPQDFKAFIIGNEIIFTWSIFDKQQDILHVKLFHNDFEKLQMQFDNKIFRSKLSDEVLGKYYIVAIDRAGFESQPSQTIYVSKKNNKYYLSYVDSGLKDEYIDVVRFMKHNNKLIVKLFNNEVRDKVVRLKMRFYDGTVKKIKFVVKP